MHRANEEKNMERAISISSVHFYKWQGKLLAWLLVPESWSKRFGAYLSKIATRAIVPQVAAASGHYFDQGGHSLCDSGYARCWDWLKVESVSTHLHSSLATIHRIAFVLPVDSSPSSRRSAEFAIAHQPSQCQAHLLDHIIL